MSASKNSTDRPKSTPMIEPMLAATDGSFRTLIARATNTVQRGEQTRILFVSPTPDCGNTTIAACAAITLARDASRPVRFIEADIYRPASAGYLEVEARPGLLEVAAGEAKLDAAIQTSPFHGLSVLPAGGAGDARQGALGDSRIHEVLQEALRQHEIAVIDGPAVLEHTDVCSLARYATDVVLVARAGHTSRHEIKSVLEILTAGGIHPVGVYLNRARRTNLFGVPFGG